MSRNLISLFAGAGGLDLGLEMAGFNTVVANELEDHYCETLRKNKILSCLDEKETNEFIEIALEQKCFKRLKSKNGLDFFNRLKELNKRKFLQNAEIISGDIRSIPTSKFKENLPANEELFAIAGGPPCQPFSKAGKQKSLDCTKNGDLFFEFVRLVRDLRPKWFLFENVKGITFTKTDVLYAICQSCSNREIADFELRQNWKADNNIKTKCTKCDASNTRFQIRNEKGGSLKIILNEFQKIGYNCSSKVLNSADFGASQIRERLFIVGSREGLAFKWPTATHEKVTLKNKNTLSLFDTKEFFKLKPWNSMFDSIWSKGHAKYGKLDKSKAVLWVKNVVRPHNEPVIWSLNRPSPTIGAHQGAKLAIAPNGVPEKQIFRQQWHSLGRRQGDTPPVPVEHEYLTDEELLRLQTFPSWWYLHGTRMQRAFQIGNAVPPILAKKVGESIVKAEKNEPNYVTSF